MQLARILLCCALVHSACDKSGDDDDDTTDTQSTDTSSSTTDDPSTGTSSNSGSDTNDTSTSSQDTNGDTGDGSHFLNATGTINGEPATFNCNSTHTGPQFYSTQKAGESGGHLLGVACNVTDEDLGYSINIGVFVTEPKSQATCEPNTWGIQVLQLFEGKAYNCALNEVESFLINIDTYSPNSDGSVQWGGNFQVTGMSDTMAIDLSGNFQIRTPAPM